MAHHNTLELNQSALVIIDMQDAFRTKLPGFAEIAERISVMVQGARLLHLPIIVTEQYPKGLGHTAAEIKNALPSEIEVIEKTAFSSCGAAQFRTQLEAIGTRQVLVCGIEAHICVNQTVHDLLAANYQVHVLTDCIGAREENNKQVAIAKMTASGAILCSIEMALFELIGDAMYPEFKRIQALVR